MPYRFDRISCERDEYYYDRDYFPDISIPVAQECWGDFGAETDDLLKWFQVDGHSLPRLPQYFIRPRLRKTWRRDINARVSQYDVNGEIVVCKPVQWIPHATIIRSFPTTYYESDTHVTTIESDRIFKRVQTHVESDGWTIRPKSSSRSYVNLEYHSSEVEKIVVKERHSTRGRLVELVLGMTLEVEEVFTHRVHMLLGAKSTSDWLTWYGGPSWEDIRIANSAFNKVRHLQYRKISLGDDYDSALWIQALPVLDHAKNVVALDLAFSCDGWANWYAYLSGRPCKSTGREVLAWHSWKPRVMYLATRGNLIYESSNLVTTSSTREDTRSPSAREDTVSSQSHRKPMTNGTVTSSEQDETTKSSTTKVYESTTSIDKQPEVTVTVKPQPDDYKRETVVEVTESRESTIDSKVSPATTRDTETTIDVYDSRTNDKRFSVEEDIWERDDYEQSAIRDTYVQAQQSQTFQPILNPQPVAPLISSEYAMALTPVMQQMYIPQQPQIFQPQYIQPQTFLPRNFQPQSFQPQMLQPYAKIPQSQTTTAPRLLNGYDETSYGRRSESSDAITTWEQKSARPRATWPWLFAGWGRRNYNANGAETIRYPFTTYPNTTPKVALGLSVLDISCDRHIRAYVTETHTREYLELSLGAWNDTQIHTVTGEIMTFSGRDDEIQVGRHDARGFDHCSKHVRVDFERAFAHPPRVVAFFSKLDLSHRHEQKARVVVTNVDRAGFTLHTGNLTRTELHNYAVHYVAFPHNKANICGEHGVQITPHRGMQSSGWISFPSGKFSGAGPWVMLALSGVNIGRGRKVAVAAEVTEITREGFRWRVWGWDGVNLRGVQVSWIAQAAI